MRRAGFKFFVIKAEDLFSTLNENGLLLFGDLLDEFNKWRREVRGKPINSYYVINRDEPYADEIRDVLRKHIPEGEWSALLTKE